MQARLSATGKGAPRSTAAGGAAAALAASLSAFSTVNASRTSLVAAPRSGWCSRSLASSGFKPRSGSDTRKPRTASSRASGVQGSRMRGVPGQGQPLARPSQPVARLAKFGRREHVPFLAYRFASLVSHDKSLVTGHGRFIFPPQLSVHHNLRARLYKRSRGLFQHNGQQQPESQIPLRDPPG
eukprot:scaffold56166_cov64-Phaeocystis_antarctica.AAC.4